MVVRIKTCQGIETYVWLAGGLIRLREYRELLKRLLSESRKR